MGARQPGAVSPMDRVAGLGLEVRDHDALDRRMGGIAGPFYFQNGHSLVRLDGREPARQKTFEEATPEVSTSFQDAESKRLEKEWMNGLKARFPVQENKAPLKDAFTRN